MAENDTDLALHIAVLLGLAPAAIKQGLRGGHTGRRGRSLVEEQTPVSVRMASAVCARAKDRISAGALVI